MRRARNDDDDDDEPIYQPEENRQPVVEDGGGGALVLHHQPSMHSPPPPPFSPPPPPPQYYQHYQHPQHPPSPDDSHCSPFVNLLAGALAAASSLGFFLVMHWLCRDVGQTLVNLLFNRVEDLRSGYNALRNGTMTYTCSVGGPALQQLECEVGSLTTRILYAGLLQTYELFSILFKSTNLLHTLALLSGLWAALRTAFSAVWPVVYSVFTFCLRLSLAYHGLWCRALEKHLP